MTKRENDSGAVAPKQASTLDVLDQRADKHPDRCSARRGGRVCMRPAAFMLPTGDRRHGYCDVGLCLRCIAELARLAEGSHA